MISAIVTRGFGPPGSPALIVTHGFSSGAAPVPVTPPVKVDLTLDFCYVRNIDIDVDRPKELTLDFPHTRNITVRF